MEAPENFLAYDPEQLRYTLVGSNGHVSTWLIAGDILALSIGGQDQRALVAHGGYRGWYFVTADGRRGRFALSMKAQLLTHAPARKEALPHATSSVPLEQHQTPLCYEPEQARCAPTHQASLYPVAC